jgi:hypothetical protein
MMAAHRKEWKNASPELNQLSRRAVRVLCGDPQTTDDRVFVRALKASGRLSQSRWLAERLLDAYDIGWTPERAKYLAPTIMAAFGLHRRCSSKATVFLQTRGLLSDQAADAIADLAIASLLNPAELAERFRLAQDGALLRAVRVAIGPVWARRVELAKDGPPRQALFEFGFKFLVEPVAIAALDRAAAVQTIILATRPTDAVTISWLRNAVIRSRHLGDPRKPANRNNWSMVSPATKRRFIQWLAKEDLRFFFEAVMENTPDPHGRQEFWNDWLENERLVDSCVALSTRDFVYLQSRGLIAKDSQFSRVSGSADEVSAFLLRFRTSSRDVIAVEFSRAGNAAYFHDGADFEKRFEDMHRPFFRLSDLKNTQTELDPPPGLGSTWDWHRPGWEHNFRRALSYYLR